VLKDRRRAPHDLRSRDSSGFATVVKVSGMNLLSCLVLVSMVLESETHSMRHISATAMLLVFILGALAPACVAGWNGSYQLLASHCEEVPQPSAGMHCAHRTSYGPTRAEVKADEPCGHAFTARPGQCGLRSFIQLHFASFHAAEISVPVLTASKVASPSRVVIMVSSVGPPETDRGPPRG
jgi:hypothetical protein